MRAARMVCDDELGLVVVSMVALRMAMNKEETLSSCAIVQMRVYEGKVLFRHRGVPIPLWIFGLRVGNFHGKGSRR